MASLLKKFYAVSQSYGSCPITLRYGMISDYRYIQSLVYDHKDISVSCSMMMMMMITTQLLRQQMPINQAAQLYLVVVSVTFVTFKS